MHDLNQKRAFSPKHASLKLGLFVFFYALAIGLFVQLILLPHFLPHWHAGNGLIVDHDWVVFHKEASQIAADIRLHGWSVWQINPRAHGGTPVGIASAVYALTFSKPWALLPLNALLHAAATVTLYQLILLISGSWLISIFSALPFALFPSAMTWYTQIHRDGVACLGFILSIFGMSSFFSARTWTGNVITTLKRGSLSSLWVALGAACLAISRPYQTDVLVGLEAPLLLFFVGLTCFRLYQKHIDWKKAISGCAVLAALIFCTSSFKVNDVNFDIPQTQAQPRPATPKGLADLFDEPTAQARASLHPKYIVRNLKNELVALWDTVGYASEDTWIRTDWLPAGLERKFFNLARVRDGFRWTEPSATSNIDQYIGLHCVTDVLAYIPRAIEIGLLAPFPSQWLSRGTTSSSGVTRKIAGIEMMFVYLAELGLLFAVPVFLKKPEFCVAMYFSIAMISIHSLVIVNVGTLYRTRYSFIMALVALGVPGLFIAAAWLRGRALALVDHLKPTGMPTTH